MDGRRRRAEGRGQKVEGGGQRAESRGHLSSAICHLSCVVLRQTKERWIFCFFGVKRKSWGTP